MITEGLVRRAPKVVLHDHLDGGLRPSTVVELARWHGYEDLPTTDVSALADWFDQGRGETDLVGYLTAFSHTVGVMQHADALTRVARESAEDLAEDGVVYAEVRFAPELHTAAGLSPDEVVRAVLDGFADGTAGLALTIRAIVTAMRTGDRSTEMAEVAAGFARAGVVGFDIAGAEAGNPPGAHADAFAIARAAGLGVTIHAGEAAGPASIREALEVCQADRIGHGVRIIEDVDGADHPAAASLGRTATAVRDRRIPLEVCPTSNVHTGVVPTVAAHPVDRLRRLGFHVTVHTDNRLMSRTSMTGELHRVATTFGWSLEALEQMTLDAVDAAFLPADEVATLRELVRTGYTSLDRPSERPGAG